MVCLNVRSGIGRVFRGPQHLAAPRSGGVLLLAILLAGCGADSHLGARALAVQGKHEWQSCDQLSGLRSSLSKRIDETTETMDKASRDAGGGLVNATVHWPTLAGLQAERRLVDETMAEKGCPGSVASTAR